MARKRNGIKINWTRLLLCVFFFYAMFIFSKQQLTIHKMKSAKSELLESIEIAEKDNMRLKEMLENVTDEKHIERMAREQLGLVKPGEIVYVDQSSSDVYLQEGGN